MDNKPKLKKTPVISKMAGDGKKFSDFMTAITNTNTRNPNTLVAVHGGAPSGFLFHGEELSGETKEEFESSLRWNNSDHEAYREGVISDWIVKVPENLIVFTFTPDNHNSLGHWRWLLDPTYTPAKNILFANPRWVLEKCQADKYLTKTAGGSSDQYDPMFKWGGPGGLYGSPLECPLIDLAKVYFPGDDIYNVMFTYDQGRDAISSTYGAEHSQMGVFTRGAGKEGVFDENKYLEHIISPTTPQMLAADTPVQNIYTLEYVMRVLNDDTREKRKLKKQQSIMSQMVSKAENSRPLKQNKLRALFITSCNPPQSILKRKHKFIAELEKKKRIISNKAIKQFITMKKILLSTPQLVDQLQTQWPQLDDKSFIAFKDDGKNRIARLFDQYDTNADHKITLNELDNIIHSQHPQMDKFERAIFLYKTFLESSPASSCANPKDFMDKLKIIQQITEEDGALEAHKLPYVLTKILENIELYKRDKMSRTNFITDGIPYCQNKPMAECNKRWRGGKCHWISSYTNDFLSQLDFSDFKRDGEGIIGIPEVFDALTKIGWDSNFGDGDQAPTDVGKWMRDDMQLHPLGVGEEKFNEWKREWGEKEKCLAALPELFVRDRPGTLDIQSAILRTALGPKCIGPNKKNCSYYLGHARMQFLKNLDRWKSLKNIRDPRFGDRPDTFFEGGRRRKKRRKKKTRKPRRRKKRKTRRHKTRRHKTRRHKTRKKKY